ncbi:hypothetical protein TRV_03510 [Trichophyton verrucosum HKI 0517]|uniref:Uncharacterized protein n=1 Tax=Trichophyton verrucosum (strain HKI 0517) TaxID=663202 RepID=D4D8S2_TRIVH|nr:uncharacterized protein TRV_03510 [Trichophyton verrucosum HKI 0517]EFE41681.1 hypothetical protein TRV_03510 [Trichophyton verrucosum HKI 0517]
MAAGIAVELRFLRSLMEVRLEVLPVVEDWKKKRQTQGGEAERERERERKAKKKKKRKKNNNNDNDDDVDQSAAGKRLTDGQTHDEESDKKAPLFEYSKTARRGRFMGSHDRSTKFLAGLKPALAATVETYEVRPGGFKRSGTRDATASGPGEMQAGGEAEPGAAERDNKRRNKRKREKGRDKDQGKLKNRRSVFNWRWILEGMERQKVKETEKDGRGGGETALVDKGGITATGRPFSDNTSDNETMQDYDADDRNRPAERSVGVEGRQLDHSSQATRWA